MSGEAEDQNLTHKQKIATIYRQIIKETQAKTYLTLDNVIKVIFSRSLFMSLEGTFSIISLFMCVVEIYYRLLKLPDGPLNNIFGRWSICGLIGASAIIISDAKYKKNNAMWHLTVISLFSVIFSCFGSSFFKTNLNAIIFSTAAYSFLLQFTVVLLCPDKNRSKHHLRVAQLAFSVVVLTSASDWFNQHLTYFTTETYDYSIVQMESVYAFRFTAILRFISKNYLQTNAALNFVYGSIPAAMVVHDVYFNKQKFIMTKLFIVSSGVGYILYFIVPVAGTDFLFLNYDDISAPLILDILYNEKMHFPRSSIPSLHTTWGIFLVISSVHLYGKNIFDNIVSFIFILYGVSTILAAMVVGQHYLTDILVAIPFSISIFTLVNRLLLGQNLQNIVVAPIGILLTALWIIAIRWGSRFGCPDYVVLFLTFASLAFAGAFPFFINTLPFTGSSCRQCMDTRTVAKLR